MMHSLPDVDKKPLDTSVPESSGRFKLTGKITSRDILFSWGIVTISFFLLLVLHSFINATKIETIISPILSTLIPGKEKKEVLKGHEVFGFAPYWTLQKLDNVDFSTLTTLAYFGVPIDEEGHLVKDDLGYERFHSERATKLFEKAHASGTRVVLTVTIMENDVIEEFLENPDAQKRAIQESVDEVKRRGIDGVNVDIEYLGDPGQIRRDAFSNFVKDMTTAMHKEVPESRVTVSVYAASVKTKKLYDIASLGKHADGVFMMAYDFATTGSDSVIPTSPLYGYKEGKYWYDVSTAVEDFLTVMPADKLILGLPWYGYNYPVSEPEIKAAKYEGYSYYYWQNYRRKLAHFRPTANAQTYAAVAENVAAERAGWDDVGKVGWQAYQTDGIWRMIFLDDERSLKLKYQFAKDKKLAGVGMWALGFDNGRTELWDLLKLEFGEKLADSRVDSKRISRGGI
jgi:spore germination protein YaaH